MAYYEFHDTTMTSNQILIDLAAFVAANGWVIDFDGVYNTSYRRLHFHKGQAHFDLYSSSVLAGIMYGCTGYSAGSAPNAQPGVSAAKTFAALAAPSGYWFISTVGGIYICFLATTSLNFTNWICFFTLQDKIGAWADGFGLSGGASGDLFDTGWCASPEYGQLYYNGIWSGTAIALGGVVGTTTTSDLPTKAPNYYNAGIVPFPVLLSLCSLADTTKRQPLGYAPGLYRSNGGDIYNIADELTIGTDTYLILPRMYNYIGQAGSGDYLFKLGA
jgi:hypothetical protein